MPDNPSRDRIDFIIGEEKTLPDILTAAEIVPLLHGVVKAGANQAVVTGRDGEPLWTDGRSQAGEEAIILPLQLEGEPAGNIGVFGPAGRQAHLEPMAGLLQVAVQTLLNNNLKRMLTTEIHTSVVNQSYEELLETNRQLAESEAKHKNLAENLALIVEQRSAELQRAYASLLQKEKMAAIGQLAAGMAHEINNPLGFIVSNLNSLQKYVARCKEMLLACRDAAARGQSPPDFPQHWQRLKLDPILADVDELFRQSLAGGKRIEKIVADLKAFSHIDDAEKTVVNLNQEIDLVLKVLAPQMPTDGTVIRNYATLPGFLCNPAQLNQAIMNIVMNAIQAKPHGLRLAIDTLVTDDTLLLRFTDNGPGIRPEILPRIFDPFFTTKEVGAGMGMGLANAYEIVTSCGGHLEVASTPGQGAQFTIALPATTR
ncbi:MAG TPA: ATP-binding protein [Desulfurivibrionaceae bacterium]|nr:ATP-binding protein [Desulfurivibrionaceae bacterium]